MVDDDAVDVREEPAQENAAIALRGHCANRGIDVIPSAGKTAIERPVRIQSGDSAAGDVIGHGEVATGEDHPAGGGDHPPRAAAAQAAEPDPMGHADRRSRGLGGDPRAPGQPD